MTIFYNPVFWFVMSWIYMSFAFVGAYITVHERDTHSRSVDEEWESIMRAVEGDI